MNESIAIETAPESAAAQPTAPAAPAPARRRSTASQRVIAAGIIVAACVYASSVIMTLLFAVLAAYFLDPFVVWLEKIRMPRALGAMIVVLLAVSFVVGIGYLAVDSLDEFSNDWPRYSAVMKKVTTDVNSRLEQFESRVSEIAPKEAKPSHPVVEVQQPQRPVRDLLVSGLGSIYVTILLLTFVPFLILFMLAGKNTIWRATLGLFPGSQRSRAKDIFDNLSRVLRGYVAGTVFVAIILMLASWVFFWAIGLANPFLAGVVSGLLNLVPYLGAVLAWIPPMIIGMTTWHTIGPFAGIAAALLALHIIANNVLIPAIVGRRVHLNALAVTLALLFWGWAWGAIGLILAIPITASIKVICDHVEAWQPIGNWLGSGE
jgi:predicted PurR-regulated permease PerM